MNIRKKINTDQQKNIIYLISDMTELDNIDLQKEESHFIRQSFEQGDLKSYQFNRFQYRVYVQVYSDSSNPIALEKLRREGDKAAAFFKENGQKAAVLSSPASDIKALLAFAEGMALGSYEFTLYKPKAKNQVLFDELIIDNSFVTDKEIEELENIVKSVYEVRDMVNEPVNVLDALTFANRMADKCRAAGAKVTIMEKEDIEKYGMTGLLTVNRGSKSSPTFTIIEWKPDTAVVQQPIVLVGKGLVFDTGGINLKPGAGLDTMKSDMAGGAAVFGTLYALALNNVPRHVIGLIPATDNRPGENAMVPGDIIRMKNNKTIEIINTDAEGRLILADALIYASQYNPQLVIDVATLTGAAQVAIGRFGIAAMQQDADNQINSLKESGMRVYERIVELPFWEEYGKDIESDIADIRNLGKGKGAGTITAGKFLAHFISYPWIHLDIAPNAFMDAREGYMGKGATAVGVRLMYDFIARN